MGGGHGATQRGQPSTTLPVYCWVRGGTPERLLGAMGSTVGEGKSAFTTRDEAVAEDGVA